MNRAGRLFAVGLTTGASVAGAVAALRTPRVRRQLGRLRRRIRARQRYLGGKAQGWRYRLSGQHPDPNVTTDVLEQRVRSALGVVMHRLDLPKVHVDVRGHDVTLFGPVPTADAAAEIEDAAAGVSGVSTVSSYLEVDPTVIRPSQARAEQASGARHELLGAARGVGIGDDEDVERAVRAILATFFELIPRQERRHVLGHLPDDVRALLEAPIRVGRPPKPRTVDAFMDAVVDSGGRSPGTTEHAVHAVLGTLRELVPEEADDVAAVLPAGLKALWTGNIPSTTGGAGNS